MADEIASLGIKITADDQATAKLRAFSDEAERAASKVEKFTESFSGPRKEAVKGFADEIRKTGQVSSATLDDLAKKAPAFAGVLADALGVPAEEFRNLASAGRLTADVVAGAFAKLGGSTSQAVAPVAAAAGAIKGHMAGAAEAAAGFAASLGGGGGGGGTPGGGGPPGGGGGIAAAAASAAPRLLALGGVLGVVAAATVVSAKAAWDQSQASHAFEQGLAGVGKQSGATVQSLMQLSAESAKTGKISTGAAQEMALEYLKTGRIGVEQFSALIAIQKDYAYTTGQSIPAATKELAAAFADPAKGVDLLQSKLGPLTLAQYEFVKSQDAMGNRSAAQTAMMGAFAGKIADAEKALNPLERVYHRFVDAVKTDFADLGAKTLKLISPATDEDNLTNAKAARAAIPEKSTAGFLPGLLDFGGVRGDPSGAIAAADALVQKYQDLVDAKKASDTELLNSGAANAAAQAGQAIVNGLDPAIEQFEKLQAAHARLTAGLATGQIDSKDGASALGALNEAKSRNITTQAPSANTDPDFIAPEKFDATATGLAKIAIAYDLKTRALKASNAEETIEVKYLQQREGAANAVQLTLVKEAELQAGKKLALEGVRQATERAAAADAAALQTITARTAEERKAAAVATLTADASFQKLGAQEQLNAVAAIGQKLDAADSAGALDVAKAHEAKIGVIKAETQAEYELAKGRQAAAQHPGDPATADAASSSASSEAQAQDLAGARDIGRAYEANLKAVQAITVEEKASAAAAQAAAQHRQGSLEAATAAAAAYALEMAKARAETEAGTRALQGQAGILGTRIATVGMNAPDRAGALGRAEATNELVQKGKDPTDAAGQAFINAAENVSRLGDSARQAEVSFKMVASYNGQANQFGIQLAVLTGEMSKAAGASESIMASAHAQATAAGLTGEAYSRVIQAAQGAASAAYALANAQERATYSLSIWNSTILDSTSVAKNWRDTAGPGGTKMNAKDAGAIQLVPEWLGKQMKDQYNLLGEWSLSKTAGSWDIQRNPLQQAPLAMFTPSAEGIAFAQQKANAPRLALMQAQLQFAQNGGAADAIASPLTRLIEQLTSKVESEKQSTTSAAASAPMANATKNDPRLDPYLSRNASVYYGTETDSFYKDISWQDATLASLEEQSTTATDALSTAQSQLASLQDIASRAAAMAGNTDPSAVAAAIADGLRSSGFVQEAADVLKAAQVYSLQKAIEDLQKPSTGTAGSTLGGGGSAGSGLSGGGSITKTATTMPAFGATAFVPHIGSFASGTPGVTVPGVGGVDKLFTIGLTPGETLAVRSAQSPAASSGAPVTLNQYNTIHVTDSTAADEIMRGLDSAATRAVAMRGVMSVGAQT